MTTMLHLSLLLNHAWDIQIVDVPIDGTLHKSPSIIVLDVANPTVTMHVHLLRESLQQTHNEPLLLAAWCVYLFLEVSNCIVVGVCEKVCQIFGLCIFLQVVHQSCPITLFQYSNCERRNNCIYRLTFTCSLAVIAQNATSANCCGQYGRKQIPPMAVLPLQIASEWCFL